MSERMMRLQTILWLTLVCVAARTTDPDITSTTSTTITTDPDDSTTVTTQPENTPQVPTTTSDDQCDNKKDVCDPLQDKLRYLTAKMECLYDKLSYMSEKSESQRIISEKHDQKLEQLDEKLKMLCNEMDTVQTALETNQATTLEEGEKRDQKLEQINDNMEALSNKTDTVQTELEKKISQSETTSQNVLEKVNDQSTTLEKGIDKLMKNIHVGSAGSCPMTRDKVVFLNREDGSENFHRNWTEYKSGFGVLGGEFWLGLECLYQITTSRDYYGLQVDFGDFEGNIYQSNYNHFYVGPESDFYKLHVSGYDNSSTGGDSLTPADPADSDHNLNNMKFGTYDRDNDGYSGYNCAARRTGGWWYNRCTSSHPTGLYLYRGESVHNWKGIYWLSAKVYPYSFKYMKLTLILHPPYYTDN